MSTAKDKFEQGYVDGQREADYQKNHGVIEKTIRNLGFDPQKDKSTAYQEGFKDGLKDGREKG